MINHDKGYKNRDNDGDNDGSEDGNDNDNTTSRSGSDGLIFDLTATPLSLLGLAKEDWAKKMTAIWTRRHMYIRVGIYLPYKYPINAIVNMCHKLLYEKVGVLDLCC